MNSAMYNKRWYSKNAEKKKAYTREYYKKHREEMLSFHREVRRREKETLGEDCDGKMNGIHEILCKMTGEQRLHAFVRVIKELARRKQQRRCRTA